MELDCGDSAYDRSAASRPPAAGGGSWLLGTRTPAAFQPQPPPFVQAIELVADAIEQANGAWPTFEIRALLGGNAEDRPELIHYLHVEGSFSAAEQPLGPRHAGPEVVAGRVSTSTACSYLMAWARGEAVVVGERRLRLPTDQWGPLIPDHGRLDEKETLSLLGDAFPVTASPRLIGWHLWGYSNKTPTQEDSRAPQEFILAGFRTGANTREYALHHLGRDITRFSGPGIDLVFPLPLVFDATVNEEDVVAELHLREPLAHHHFWAGASDAPWDLGQVRRRSWSVYQPGADGWVQGTLTLAGTATPPMTSVWLGREDDPEISVQVPVRPRGAEPQRAATLALLYGARLFESIQPAADARGPVAQTFELAVSNALGALGYACINVGIPVKAEGLDILAFHEGRRECLLLSVTTSGNVSRKLSGLLRTRTSIIPTLPAWTRRLLVVTPIAREHLAPADLRDCEAVGVGILSGSELQHVATDPAVFREALERILDETPPAD